MAFHAQYLQREEVEMGEGKQKGSRRGSEGGEGGRCCWRKVRLEVVVQQEVVVQREAVVVLVMHGGVGRG